MCVEPHFTAMPAASEACKTRERSVGAGAGRQAQRRPSAAAHVVLVTASCARKPAAAIMPSRACASSFSYEGEIEGQARRGQARVMRGWGEG